MPALASSGRVGIFDESTGDILLVVTYDDLRNAAIALVEQSNRDNEIAMNSRNRNAGKLKFRARKMRKFASQLLNLRGVIEKRDSLTAN